MMSYLGPNQVDYDCGLVIMLDFSKEVVSAAGVCSLLTGETRKKVAFVRPPEFASLCHAGDAVIGVLSQLHSPEKFIRVRSNACLSTLFYLIEWCAYRRWQWGIEKKFQDFGLDLEFTTFRAPIPAEVLKTICVLRCTINYRVRAKTELLCIINHENR